MTLWYPMHQFIESFRILTELKHDTVVSDKSIHSSRVTALLPDLNMTLLLIHGREVNKYKSLIIWKQ